ncbi:hypothetical protein [Microbacterium galbinum]|uniref:hypothetical protein n=1 Tax=Microbacterium galbinum TaxID=2851646 RepID=UPI001FFD4D4D|nr:hypothetical protein [Microbacterium galbinum]MCK2031234.1 hypothetical protein [Microbacterium galbinum]
MPQTQDTDDTAETGETFEPRPAGIHVSLTTRTAPVVPERRGVWPLAPWRWVLLALALLLAITCGPAAADPAVNTADLLVFLGLAIFVATFTPWSKS